MFEAVRGFPANAVSPAGTMLLLDDPWRADWMP
jgi:hypothetical protein